MSYTPKDMLDYVMSHEMEASFLTSLSLHKENFSIGEIADKVFESKDGVCRFKSKAFGIDVEITDDDVLTAVANGLYVSAFVSRKDNDFRVHFLVHKYPSSMKANFEDEITDEVVRYMIFNTIIVLRLDNKEKIRKYISANGQQ